MQGKRNKRCILSFFGALSTLFAQGFQFVDCIIFLAQQGTRPDALFILPFFYFHDLDILQFHHDGYRPHLFRPCRMLSRTLV